MVDQHFHKSKIFSKIYAAILKLKERHKLLKPKISKKFAIKKVQKNSKSTEKYIILFSSNVSYKFEAAPMKCESTIQHLFRLARNKKLKRNSGRLYFFLHRLLLQEHRGKTVVNVTAFMLT